MSATLRYLVPLALAVLGAACGSSLPEPKFATEEPPQSGTWIGIDAAPAWVAAPPQREGYLRWVVSGKSNLRSIAAARGNPSPKVEVTASVERALEPVVGTEAASRAAADALGALVMVHRACKDELLTHEMVTGNTLCTVWALWEVAIDDVVAPIDEGDRDAARAALTR